MLAGGGCGVAVFYNDGHMCNAHGSFQCPESIKPDSNIAELAAIYWALMCASRGLTPCAPAWIHFPGSCSRLHACLFIVTTIVHLRHHPRGQHLSIFSGRAWALPAPLSQGLLGRALMRSCL